jgi:hypothetical protein
VARFDIGFIGKGNPEIMKDKLTRFAREVRSHGIKHSSRNFIVVDRMPDTKKTAEAARKSGSEIVQMSMQFWPQELAKLTEARLGYHAEILDVAEDDLSDYLMEKMASMPILNFLNRVEVDSGNAVDSELE